VVSSLGWENRSSEGKARQVTVASSDLHLNMKMFTKWYAVSHRAQVSAYKKCFLLNRVFEILLCSLYLGRSAVESL
jgi:hypothetical protein